MRTQYADEARSHSDQTVDVNKTAYTRHPREYRNTSYSNATSEWCLASMMRLSGDEIISTTG